MDNAWIDEIGQVVKTIEERAVRKTIPLQYRISLEQGIQSLTVIKDILWLHRMNAMNHIKPDEKLKDLYRLVEDIIKKFEKKIELGDEDLVKKDIRIKLENSSSILKDFLSFLNGKEVREHYVFTAFSVELPESKRVSLSDVALNEHMIIKYLKNILDYHESEFLYDKITRIVSEHIQHIVHMNVPDMSEQVQIKLGMERNEKGFLFPDFFYVVINEVPIIKFDLRFKRFGSEDEYPIELQPIYNSVANELSRFGYREQEDLFY